MTNNSPTKISLFCHLCHNSPKTQLDCALTTANGFQTEMHTDIPSAHKTPSLQKVTTASEWSHHVNPWDHGALGCSEYKKLNQKKKKPRRFESLQKCTGLGNCLWEWQRLSKSTMAMELKSTVEHRNLWISDLMQRILLTTQKQARICFFFSPVLKTSHSLLAWS